MPNRNIGNARLDAGIRDAMIKLTKGAEYDTKKDAFVNYIKQHNADPLYEFAVVDECESFFRYVVDLYNDMMNVKMCFTHCSVSMYKNKFMQIRKARAYAKRFARIIRSMAPPLGKDPEQFLQHY